MISLNEVFDQFCKYLDRKLEWTKTKKDLWTNIIFQFFSGINEKETVPYTEKRDYMRIDYIWRYAFPNKYLIYDIELAVEHEGINRRIEEIIDSEVQHLIDLKAKNKIGIFYISQGSEKKFLQEISKRIKAQSDLFKLSTENPYICEKYLIILGYATTTPQRERAILFKGFIFTAEGEKEKEMEKILLQAGEK